MEEEVTIKRSQRKGDGKRRNKRKKRKSPIIKYTFLTVLIFSLIFGAFQIPKILAVFDSFSNKKLATAGENDDVITMLVLGLDNDGGKTLDSGHTDSITYVAANLKTKKAIAMPIYRDANIPVACTGTTDNINRIYAESGGGIDCLVDSVHNFLDLPIDYYAMVTINGFIDIAGALGHITLEPTGTFCSHYGKDRYVTYCFEEGIPTDMDSDMLMAYLRYRGGTSGESRANRQVELLKALKNRCFEDVMGCYNDATPHFAGAFQTNLPVTKIPMLANVFGNDFSLETLSVIDGENVEGDNGWTQIVNEQDKLEKVAIIKQLIKESETKNENV